MLEMVNNPRRLTELDSFLALDDSAYDQLHSLRSLASSVCQTPMASVSFVTKEHEIHVSRDGFSEERIPSDISFGNYVIQEPTKVLIIEDVTLDERFSKNPLVNHKAKVRFYAGVPITSSQGFVLGTLSVMDTKPRKLTREQINGLKVIAAQILNLLELRRKNHLLSTTNVELESLRALFEQIQEINKIGGWELNIETGETFWTDEVYRIHGVEKPFSHNKQIGIEFYHPDDQSVIKNCIEHAIKYGTPFNQVLRFNSATGDLKWVRATGQRIKDKHGKFRLVGSFQDITKEIKANNLIDLEKVRKERVIEASRLGTWEWNIQTGETTFNDRWLEIIGYTRDDFEKTNFEAWSSLVHPDDLREAQRRLALVFDKKASFYEVEIRMKHKLGSWVWILAQGSVIAYSENGEPLMMYGTHLDISKLKENSADLQYKEDILSNLFKLSPVGIALNDYETGRFLRVNSKLIEPSGYSEKEFLKLSSWDITPLDYVENEKQALEELKDSGVFGPYEKEYIRKDGTKYPVELRGVLIKDLDGNNRIWSIIEDISQRKENERALERALEDANSASKAKSEFLACASHEIRTPLNGILGFAELLKTTPLSQTQQNYADTIYSSGKQLLSIVNDILDLSKVESGMLELEHVNTNSRQLFKEIFDLFNYQASSKGLKLILDVSDKVPVTIKVDPLRIKQIISNLIGNAIKFTHEGKVTLRVSYKELKNNVGNLKISVIDTGIGISNAQKSRLFKAFSQGDSSITREYGGTGLGLAISSMLAEKMGGKLSFKTAVGKGSVFTCDLRISPDQSTLKATSTLGHETEKVETCVKPLRILIADDNKVNLSLVKFMLDKICPTASIYEATNGKIALELYKQNPPDIILMDIQMPELDGITASRVIREYESEKNSHVPIVALTAAALEEDKQRCIDVGIDKVVTKPLSLKDLEEVILELSNSR